MSMEQNERDGVMTGRKTSEFPQTGRMRELILALNAASEAYYGGQDELISNYEWDAMFDELSQLEEETGIILPDSPTQRVSSAQEDNIAGAKEPHEFPALSLAKTKQVSELREWAGERDVWLSWKLDGLTLVLTYDGGKLTKILTRGNGTVGTNITFMQGAIGGFPLAIAYQGHLVVRGEAVISYQDFQRINESISDPGEKYANPRNLASGTLGLDEKRLEEVKQRRVVFHAFTLVHADKEIVHWGERMDFLDSLGFNTVERERTDASGLSEVIARWTKRVEDGEMPLPADGLVICYDDTAYAATGSVTGHHATRAGYAFKWQDETAETTLRRVEWSCGATTITPVAIFDPVQLEGTTVSRASLVNLSEMERLGIGAEGETEITVIKANKIIPKVVGVRKAVGKYTVPAHCPACGAETAVTVGASGAKTLRCDNPSCPAKHLKKFARFAGKTGADIDGLSIETLRDFIAAGFVHTFPDLFRLEAHGEAIEAMEGFGRKSRENLLASIEKSRTHTDAVHFLTALCIPQIGPDAAKKLVGAYGWPGLVKALEEGTSFAQVEGIGPERSGAIYEWYADVENRQAFDELRRLMDIPVVEAAEKKSGSCAGLTFVITGEVTHFANREAFKSYVERQGGKVAGSVSRKTTFLVTNEPDSGSSKNKKAAELGIPILSEDAFIAQFGMEA